MSQLIITTDVNSIRPVFSEGTSENIKRYNQLKKLFSGTKEYQIFAEPIPAGGQKIAWHTEYEGKIIPFRKLDEEEREKTKGLLKTEVNKLYKATLDVIDDDEERNKIFNLIDSIIEIPDYDDIYLIQNASGTKHFCIVRWGFLNDEFNASKNLIANMVPLKVASIRVRAIQGNNKLAVNEKIFFEYSDNKKEFTTNEKGLIFLEDIKILTNITAYQLDKENERIYEQEYTIENEPEITFFIGSQAKLKQNVSLQTIDESNNILKKVPIRIEYDDVNFETETNQEGIYNLGELFVGTNLMCSQLKNKEIISQTSFEVTQGKTIYFVNAKKQNSSGDAQIKVVDEQNNIIPFAQIEVKYPDGKTEYFQSDEKGYFQVDNIPFKEDIIFRQVIDKLPQYQQIMQFSDEKETHVFKGKAIKTPFDYTKLTINVINSSNEPIPNLKVVVENGMKSSNQITNNAGIVVLDKVDCTKKIIVTVYNKNKKHSEEIKCSEQETNHTVKLNSQKGLWWLWLLLLLLLSGVAAFFIYNNFFNKEATPVVVADTTENTTIVQDTVPLVEVHEGMKIHILDSDSLPIPNADINIELDGQQINKTTNDKGEVIFTNLTDTTLFITAEVNASEYSNQRFTFKICYEKTLILSTGSVEISEQILPCGTQIESKGYHSTIQTFNLKKTKGQFKLLYDMFDIPDKIIVYKGRATNINQDKIIWQSAGFQKRLHKVFVKFDADSLVTVEIQGGDTTRTEWYFKVYCP